MRLEQIVEPGRPGAFFEGHGQSSTQSCKELQNGSGFGFQDGFHDYLALSIHHRYADGCLMHVQPNILFTAHKGAPFVGGVACAHNLLQKGRPFIMRLQQLTVVTSKKWFSRHYCRPSRGESAYTPCNAIWER